MKPTIVFTALLLLTNPVSAQPQTRVGVFSLGGAISVSSSSHDYGSSIAKSRYYLFSPSVSYFVVDRVEILLSPSYSRSSQDWKDEAFYPTSSVVQLALKAGLRYYFPSERIIPFVGASGGVTWIRYSSSPTPYFSIPERTYSLQAGIDYVFHPSLALEGAILYSGSKALSSATDAFGFTVGIKYFIQP